MTQMKTSNKQFEMTSTLVDDYFGRAASIDEAHMKVKKLNAEFLN